jgi:histone H4
MSSKPKRVKKILRDNEQGITKPAIKRLSYLAGCENLNAGVYEEVRHVISLEVAAVLKAAVSIVEHSRRKVLQFKDLQYSVKTLGYKIGGEQEKYDICKTIAELEKFKGACVVIAKSSFIRLVKQIMQKYKDDAKFSKSFLENLQYFIEHRMIKILSLACEAAKELANRKTVLPDDISFVYKNECKKSGEPSMRLPEKKPKKKVSEEAPKKKSSPKKSSSKKESLKKKSPKASPKKKIGKLKKPKHREELSESELEIE